MMIFPSRAMALGPRGQRAEKVMTTLIATSAAQLSADIEQVDNASAADAGNGTQFTIELEAPSSAPETETFYETATPLAR
jgi:hypothetical protein